MLNERVAQAINTRKDLFNDNFKEFIIKGIVQVGMSIDQAVIAARDYSFAVSADVSVKI